ncbi:YbaB/EbfC family nucleoid-associated protein [Saccharomonospora sp. NPDC046836]|uniref:YbaB/EbfC family nucleoid-associated protein n=1 Tax=Saccharomonospora sp. NPDC046836 TaxID=3156921 RepID=UPI0033EC8DCC
MQPNLRPGEDFQHFLDRQVQEMQQKASALSEAFAESAATVSSRDGSVTVTVAPNGALRNLQLGARACELGPARLTAAIMDTVRLAQKQTARSIADSFSIINGPGESTDLIRSFLPPEDEPDADVDQSKFADEEPEREATPPPPAPPVVPPPTARRPRPARKDEDDDEERPW